MYLCPRHHNMSADGVHNDTELDRRLRQMGQHEWEAKIGDRDEFIKVFGRSWL